MRVVERLIQCVGIAQLALDGVIAGDRDSAKLGLQRLTRSPGLVIDNQLVVAKAQDDIGVAVAWCEGNDAFGDMPLAGIAAICQARFLDAV